MRIAAGGAAIGLALSIVLLKMAPVPFAWVGAMWAIGLWAVAAILPRPRRPMPAMLLLNLGAVAAAIAMAEGVVYVRTPASSPPIYSDAYSMPDDDLGYGPRKANRARSSRSIDGRQVYAVTYTIGADGLRVSAPVSAGAGGRCVLVFGCSFAFGEGLDDNQTLPYLVGLQSGGRDRVFNFAFHGYGPNHMLAQIEGRRIEGVANCQPDVVIYEMIPDHVARAAGKTFFNNHSPRYELDPDGRPRRAGRLEDLVRPTPFPPLVEGQLQKSAIFQTWKHGMPAVSAEDVRLTMALVGRSRDLLVAQHPAVRFHVLLWLTSAGEATLYRELQRGLRTLSIPVHLVSDILPGYESDMRRYVLDDQDRHPNALANEMLAGYVRREIVDRQSPP